MPRASSLPLSFRSPRRGSSFGRAEVTAALVNLDLGSQSGLAPIAEDGDEDRPQPSMSRPMHPPRRAPLEPATKFRGWTPQDLVDGNVQLRSGAAAEAQTITQVIDLLPVEYRSSLRPKFFGIVDIATKRELVANQINRLRVDKIAGRIPNFLRSCKPPTVQFSKQARTALPNLSEAIVEGHKQYQLELLEAVIKEKEKEERQLQASLNIVAITNRLYETMAVIYDELKSSSLVPKDPKKMLEGAPEDMDEDEDLVPAPHIQAIYNSLIHEVPNLVARVIVLARARIVAEESKRKKKKELKDVAAATAGEFVPDKSSIAKMVAAQVKRQLNAKGPKPGKGAKGGKKKKDASGESKAKKKKSSKKNSDKQSKASDSKKAKSKKSKNAKRSKGKGKEKSS
ncbi:hypothetical protein F5J12DRAFT_897928 [Pisolithus orientalis]|uniref:uncharacterized protein n=1 Tax=Pisolithus orientalis TaxID=936130 RepID=UPI0022259685|nr:uncharacterized protein F5J12DRAFT_897928 [Pisolithus orientalis]KAI5989394.1 hypothetical protein F5J12DRAFT_897928 [Pisolithus orientalis]